MTKGRGGNNGGPWGRGPSSPPPPRGNNEDNIEDLIRKSQERMRGMMPKDGGNRKLVGFGIAALLLLWLAQGFYVVAPEEQGVVMRFGEYHHTTQPGLHYHLPSPIETVFTPAVTRVQRIEIGFRGFEGREQSVPEESLMLTGDENIIDVTFVVQWKIKTSEDGAKNFLFNIRKPEETVKDVAESVMREVIGKRPLTSALTEGKQDIEDANRRLMQETLDRYKAGIQIDRVTLLRADPPAAVIESFRDVQAAKADQERLINEAQAYANEILPRARGEAERQVQSAEAYRAEVTNRAQGAAARFISIYDEYKNAKDVTKKRLYLETLEDIMQGMDKVILGTDGNGVVPYMALPEITKRNRATSKKEQ